MPDHTEGSNPSGLGPSIINATDDSFELDVITRSLSGLVIVDFWAAWCGPCRALTPVLEKLANEYAGRLTLVKANTDEAPQAAEQFGVSGIPAVFAVLAGEIVNSFQGVMPEDAIRGWLEELLRQSELVEAMQHSETAPAEAEAKLREFLAESPNEAAAAIGLAELLLKQDRDDECGEIIEQLERRGFLEPQAEKIKANLALKSRAGADVSAIRAAAQAAPDDFDLQFDLAQALAGSGQYQPALESCLSLVQRDRKNTGEKARELMVEIFRVLPDDSELTSDYRRKLSRALY